MGLHTIALPVINSIRRNYPPDAGAHIALSKYTTASIHLYSFKHMSVRVK